MPTIEPATAADVAVLEAQLGRPPRGIVGIAYRCANGEPGVVATSPRLPDGTPFPTTYYLTCPRIVAAVSTVESEGVMVEMSERLTHDPDLAPVLPYALTVAGLLGARLWWALAARLQGKRDGARREGERRPSRGGV